MDSHTGVVHGFLKLCEKVNAGQGGYDYFIYSKVKS